MQTCLGYGTCLHYAQKCECYPGYVGQFCEKCDCGYVKQPDGSCKPTSACAMGSTGGDQLYKYLFSDWSACTKDGKEVFCGGGTKTLNYTCVNCANALAGMQAIGELPGLRACLTAQTPCRQLHCWSLMFSAHAALLCWHP
jgi:hypothetical protein